MLPPSLLARCGQAHTTEHQKPHQAKRLVEHAAPLPARTLRAGAHKVKLEPRRQPQPGVHDVVAVPHVNNLRGGFGVILPTHGMPGKAVVQAQQQGGAERLDTGP